jgi:hypothetical protein
MHQKNPAAEKLAWQEAVLLDPAMNDRAKVFACYLMHRLDGKKLAVTISTETMSQDLGWSLATSKRAIASLRDVWLAISRGRHGANHYRLLHDRVAISKQRVQQLRHKRRDRRLLVNKYLTTPELTRPPAQI